MKLVDEKLIAKVCHEGNRAICQAFGDYSQVSWVDAESWQQDSAVEGVMFAMDHPNAPASAQHAAWKEHKYMEGWQYGPAKDDKKKTHPCLIPFGDLPPDQQAKYYVFKAIVKALT